DDRFAVAITGSGPVSLPQVVP
ncbi:MAG: hypothetical protein QOG68_635, partial [Solirubrobacteraceae bacterium]|nr:hypothetical protein [Solirubrobacteraceae bacterium]